MCAQIRFKVDEPQRLDQARLADTPLGIPPGEAQVGLQQDTCKEMVNKIAWVLGSTYRKPYSNMRTAARAYAWRIVKQVLKDHGYPDKIAK